MADTSVPAAMQALLGQARVAARRWSAARPRTAKRNTAAQETIEAYVQLDLLVSNGAALPEAWSSAVTLPSAEEVAEALQAVALMMPIDRAPVGEIAAQVVKVMASRRVPRPARTIGGDVRLVEVVLDPRADPPWPGAGITQG